MSASKVRRPLPTHEDVQAALNALHDVHERTELIAWALKDNEFDPIARGVDELTGALVRFVTCLDMLTLDLRDYANKISSHTGAPELPAGA
jgi:hypothetical protein